MAQGTPSQKVVVACPCLNEADRAVEAITTLLDDAHSDKFDVLLLDGGSTDGTQEAVRAAFGGRVEIVHNAHRLQAHAMNMAAAIAADRGAEYLVRADLHARYPKGFVTKLCDTAQQEQAASVVVPMLTQGGNRIQTAARFLFATWLGNGGAPHRTGGYRGWVNHGHHALFKVEEFSRAGGYDPEFAANEDAEFDLRLSRSGGRIFLENEVAVDYFPRASLKTSFQQFLRNGRFRVWTAIKHGEKLAKRQLLPMAIVPILAVSILLAALSSWALLVPLAYGVLVFGLAWFAACKAEPIVPASTWGLASILAMVNHLGFSAGALFGVFELRKDGGAKAALLQARQHPDLRLTLK